jgi:hypothetical protein
MRVLRAGGAPGIGATMKTPERPGGQQRALIVVVIELVRTIVARPEGGGVQLQLFLVIGIISATRDILTVAAEFSLTGAQTPLVRTMTVLVVNVGVVLALSIALVLRAAPGQAGPRLTATYLRRIRPPAVVWVARTSRIEDVLAPGGDERRVV